MTPPPAVNDAGILISANESIRPVAAQERIQSVDVLRGWALFGILMVNMEFFAWPLSFMFFPQTWANPMDTLSENFMKVFFQGKFYTLFSTLFGWGFSIYLLKGERAGKSAIGTYVRRIVVLLIIGAIHAYLIWMGDILLIYSFTAFILLLFRKAKPKTLVLWAAILLLLPVGMSLAGAVAKMDPAKAKEIQADSDKHETQLKGLAESGLRVYPSGSFAEVTAQRTREYNSMIPFMLFFGPGILAMFLMGLYAGRKGLLHDVKAHLPFLRKLMWLGFAIGIPASVFTVWASHLTNLMGPSFLGSGIMLAGAFGNPALSYAYASALILLTQDSAWALRLRPVAMAGRMALTNYLMMSLICITIFYSHGLGMYGKMGPRWFPLIVIAIYGVELVWSTWWLKRFHFGPMEWFWRTMTYGKAQPMRIGH
ncbi:MAG TPA: DUF418 domain-containing protein [Terriglobales bacterium]|nr:DUF418 domain-containing protein [Terriglobales bacterium]